MNKKIIYLKETSSYDNILKNKHNKMPLFLKKLIFLYKNLFNIITKKKIEDYEIWILPLKEKYSINKIESLLKKDFLNSENIYVVSNELKEQQTCKLLKEYEIEYITEEKVKKVLVTKVLSYVAKLKNKNLEDLELTILVNNTSNINMYIIEELAKLSKSLKIVSLNIYKFKKLEEKLYNEEGIAIQFSNSYKKSLEKSNVIINLDFSELEINEYEIYNKAIIINCMENIKIKSRLFNGIVINSFDINLKKEFINQFKEIKIYENYTRLLMYASLIEKEDNIYKIYEEVKQDKVEIINLIGNNGIINKKEFKNIDKKLDKKLKKE